MKKTAVAILALGLCACGGKSSNGSGSTGTGTGTGTGGGPDGGPAATVTIQLNLVGAGTGRVTSQPAGIDCPGTCAMAVAPGTAVTLTATADATSHFEGYGGGCSGLSCSFTADTTTKPIFANFTPLVVQPGQHTVTVAVAGSTGTVTSTPNGITCPGVCSAQFADGAKVALTATSTAGNTVTWSGACTGTADCLLTVTADAAVTATFADPCAGLVPALPDFLTATGGVAGPGLTCDAADSDGAGNVYWNAIALGAQATIFANGTRVTDLDAQLPLATGFATILTEPASDVNHFAAIEPDGSHGTDTALPVGLLAFGRGARAGSVVVVADCADIGSAAPVDWQILHFDDAAKQVGTTVTVPGQPCARPTVLVDDQGLTFAIYETFSGIGTVPAQHLAARWFDAAGKPVTDWFDAGVAEPAPPALSLVRPLIGGGVALRFDLDWTQTIPSGKAQLVAAPAAFPSGKDLRIVEGGKAYLTIPDASTTGTLDVLTPAGKACGAVTEIKVNLGDIQGLLQYYVGKDGTLIGLTGGPTHCTAQYYPHLLK
ncbi:MAG TPA: hypothetical protein VGH20_12100 [Myxococcales bacterium]|jgi:hypothetical protein